MKDLRKLILNYPRSLRDFEKESGISRATINNIINHKHKPTRVTIIRICNFLNADWEDYWPNEN